MEIEKNINGYTIEVNFEEYDILIEALRHGEEYWEEKFGEENGIKRFKGVREFLEETKHRYLTDKETEPIINCLVCKNCLPPSNRKMGKICKLNKCIFEPA